MSRSKAIFKIHVLLPRFEKRLRAKYVYMHLYMYVYMYTYITILNIHLCIYIYLISIYIYIYMYMYIYIYIYIYINIYVYIKYMFIWLFVSQYIFSYAIHDQVLNFHYRSFSSIWFVVNNILIECNATENFEKCKNLKKFGSILK